MTQGQTSVSVPPGASSATVELVISAGNDVAGGEYVRVGPAIRLGPAGQTFAAPVSVTLAFDPNLFPAGKGVADLIVQKRDDSSGVIVDLTPSSVDASANRVTLTVTSFSTLQPVVKVGVDPARSRVQITPNPVPADGTVATVSVTVLGPSGQPLPGKSVQLSATGAGAITQPTQPTDAAGVTQGAIASLQPGTATVSVRVEGTLLDEQPTVEFSPPYSPPPPPPPMADHVLLSEVVWSAGTATLSGGSFIELYNPTAATVDLSSYYLTDTNQSPLDGGYHDLPGIPGNGSTLGLANDFFDFVLQFPPGSTLAPGARITVAMDGAAFAVAYGADADYCLGGQAGTTVQMLNYQFASGTFTQAPPAGASVWFWPGEKVALFRWDGVSDLVQDVDLVQAEGVIDPAKTDKTGIMVDGPDADALPSTYLPDTVVATQAEVPLAGALITQRIDFNETGELKTGGNGISGNDETSEPLNLTWVTAATATPGQP